MDRKPIDMWENYFNTFRDELITTKARTFGLLVLCVVGAPILTYFITQTSSYQLRLVAPLAVQLLLILYLSEQQMLMRTGKCIRDKVETDDSD